MHTTNYYNTFIAVAEDCPVTAASLPPVKAGAAPTLAALQLSILAEAPYSYTSDDLIFRAFAMKNGIPDADANAAREAFFSKGQPCLRASSVTKRYGWGIHYNAEGKIAAFQMESEAYQNLAADPALNQLKAMRTKRAG
jgi:hypothetical protein